MARYRRGATGYARASYSEVYDMHTEFGKTTLIGVHTPTTSRWQYLLRGFMHQFKKFRYKGASLSFVPVATLPADPLQVSYEAGEQIIDPRDLMNPIIHCGMRGESMGNYLDEIFQMNISHYLNSLDVADLENDAHVQDLENAYYSALMSPSFRKSHPQQGFRKSGLHPMVYGLSTNQPYNYVIPTGMLDVGRTDIEAAPTIGFDNGGATGTLRGNATGEPFTGSVGTDYVGALGAQYTKVHPLGGDENRYAYGQFFTNKLQSLGWFDTISRYTTIVPLNSETDTVTVNNFTALPKVFMYFIMLPPAYKTEMYFRVVVKHYFEFKGFRTMVQPFAFNSGEADLYDGPIQNDPVESAQAMEVATLDVYNGEAQLISDGAM